MRTKSVFLSALLLGVSPAVADIITQTQGATLLDVGNSFGVPVEFNPFDPALGVLTEVTLGLTASFSGSVEVTNTSAVEDHAAGIIAGSVSVYTSGNLVSVEVFPSAQGPTHDLAPGASATDSVSGPDQSATASAPPPASALPLFIGDEQIFLTLDATSFPLVQGLESESVSDTANAHATVTLTYDYTPASSVPEPGTFALGTIGFAWLLGMSHWSAATRVSARRRRAA